MASAMSEGEAIMAISDRALLLKGIKRTLDCDELLNFFSDFVLLDKVVILDHNIGLLVLKESTDRELLLSLAQGKSYIEDDKILLSLLNYRDAMVVYKMFKDDTRESDEEEEAREDDALESFIKREEGERRAVVSDLIKKLHGLDEDSRNQVVLGLTPKRPPKTTKLPRGLKLEKNRGSGGAFTLSPLRRGSTTKNGNGGILDEECDADASPAPQLWVPKISTFSGDGSKGEATFAQWKYEVTALVKDAAVPVSTVMLGVRRSLKGSALEIMLNMGDVVNPDPLLAKLDIIFGNVFTSEHLLEKFFGASQHKDEKVARWACRLEELAARANEKSPGVANDAMKRSKFWMGLRNDTVKTATRHKFDAGQSFEKLVVACRIAEAEPNEDNAAVEKPGQTVKVEEDKAGAQVAAIKVQMNQNDAKLSQILDMVRDLKVRVDEYEKGGNPIIQQPPNAPFRPPFNNRSGYPRPTEHAPQTQPTQHQQPLPTCHNCGDSSHFWRRCPNPRRNLNEG